MTVSLILLAGILAGCGQQDEAGAREYEIRGIVREPLSEKGAIVVEHEDVPGLMPAMTMPFTLAKSEEGADLVAGDGVAFTLVLNDEGAVIKGLHRIDADSVKLPAPEPVRAAAPVKRLKEGNQWPDFALTSQDGRTVTRADFDGAPVLVNFIFVRCPIPNYCPLMTRYFLEIRKALSPDSGVRLLSISFDPADTPEVLREYASARGADWTFATGAPEEVEKLTRAFSVRIEQEGGTYNHGLCTALIGPDGRVRALWRGNGWKPEEVIEAVQGELRKDDSQSLSTTKPNP